MNSILVIDDNQLILDFLQMGLTRKGFRVDTAKDGREGIQKFENGLYNLVITDMEMPELSGREVVRFIRHSKKRDIPIIGISAHPSIFRNVDVNSVLEKPFRLKKLIKTIDYTLVH